MKCLRCSNEMKHYPINAELRIFGKEHRETPFSPLQQKPHNPNSVYCCEKCGYMELSSITCEDPDI